DADARGTLRLGAGQRLDLLRLALAEHADLLGLGLRERLDLRRLLLGAGEVGLALVGLDRDRELRLREHGLLLGARLRLAQLALLDGGLLLAVVGLDLLESDLTRAELCQDLLDLPAALAGRRRADQHFLELEVVLAELLLHLLARNV